MISQLNPCNPSTQGKDRRSGCEVKSEVRSEVGSEGMRRNPDVPANWNPELMSVRYPIKGIEALNDVGSVAFLSRNG